MGKKTPQERREAHQRHLQRAGSKKQAEGLNPFSLTDEQQRAAAVFAVNICPVKTAELSGLDQKTITKIANGNFRAQGQQVVGIVRAATTMGWAPEFNG